MVHTFWNEVENMHDEMENVFNSLYGYPKKQRLGWAGGQMKGEQPRMPMCCMDWQKDNLVTQFELPGVEKGDIQLNVGNGFLEVKVDKKEETRKEENGVKQHFMSTRSFYRQVPLPENADSEHADAEFKNGLLKITMPKKSAIEDKTKRLQIR